MKKTKHHLIKKIDFTPPDKIFFKSDGTLITLEQTLQKSTHRKEMFFIYVYIKASETSGKLGSKLPLRRQDIENILEKEIGTVVI